MRIFWIIAAALPVVAVAAPGLDALCAGEREAEIVISGHEFSIIGFDIETQSLSIRPPRTLFSDHHGSCRLRLNEEHVLVPITEIGAVQVALDAWRASALDLRVLVERRDTDAPPARTSCQQLAPQKLTLEVDGYVLGTRDLSQPIQVPSGRPVHVGALLAEPWVKRFRTDRLRNAVYLQSQLCLGRQGDAANNVRGSISIELKTSPDGHPKRPKLAVDGLVNRPLTHCLLREISDDPLVWKDLPDNAQIYVPVFFRAGTTPPRDSTYINAAFSVE